jgi:hypothetical protein
MGARRFTARVETGPRGRRLVRVPFDPDAEWGAKPVHHVAGTVAGHPVRAVVEVVDGEHVIAMGPAWWPDCPVGPEPVEVELAPEGPQRADLPLDLTAALDANPSAGAFFDSLAQFYRRAHLRRVEGARRRPEERARRVAEVVDLCERGIKQRPAPGASGG